MRTRLSFEETRKEVVSLLEAGKEEFEKGEPFTALAILLEAQYLLRAVAVRNGQSAQIGFYEGILPWTTCSSRSWRPGTETPLKLVSARWPQFALGAC